eukprot:m.8207 g.8207  ORF g.8207 m.8207 type:complete len:101 (+) comp20420_c0_seq1:103-405(+)
MTPSMDVARFVGLSRPSSATPSSSRLAVAADRGVNRLDLVCCGVEKAVAEAGLSRFAAFFPSLKRRATELRIRPESARTYNQKHIMHRLVSSGYNMMGRD